MLCIMLKNFFRLRIVSNIASSTCTLNARRDLVQHNLKFNRCFFHTNPVKLAKYFVESENLYAYSILQTIPVTEKAIFLSKNPNEIIATEEDFNRFLAKDWRKTSACEILQAFKNVSDFCVLNVIPVSDPRFDQLVDGLMDHVEKLSDDELSDLFKCLIKFPLCLSYDAHNFHDIWSALDDICLMRMHKWSLATRFQFAEFWYRLNLGRLCDYIFQFTDKLSKNAVYLTKDQLVHAFFYMNVTRNRNVSFEFEYALEKIVDELSVDELGIVALGYFKTESKIKLQPIIHAMCRRIIEEHATVHEITLSAILKVLRFTNNLKSGEMLYSVLEHLEPEIPRLSNLTCTHIALLGTNLQIYHETCLAKLVEKLSQDLDNPEKLRLKEIERLLLVTTMFDFNVPDFYDKCLKQLKAENRRPERAKYLRCLPCALHYLSIRKIFDYDLLNEVLDKDYILHVYGRSALPRELTVLDYSIEIECPDYKGNRLYEKIKKRVVKTTIEPIPTLEREQKTVANRLFMKIQKAASKLTGDASFCLPLHILPHFVKADIILCKNIKTGEFVIPKIPENYTISDVKYPVKDETLKWYALVILTYNQTFRERSKPLGLMDMKARQLRAIGYEPIFVCWYDVHPKTDEETVHLLKDLLS